MTSEREAVLMDGTRLADEMLQRLRDQMALAGNPPVCLATVIASEERADLANLRRKHIRAAAVGLRFRDVRLAPDITQHEAESAIGVLASDPKVDGIFVQTPLPQHLDAEAILDAIPPEKDVDGATAQSLGRVMRGETTRAPCTALAIVHLLQRYGIRVAGSQAVVVGSSPELARPLALLLSLAGSRAGVTITGIDAPGLVSVCRQADIVVSVAGRPKSITREHVKPGAAVVDAGVSRSQGKLIGDVDYEDVRTIAGAIAPMPGGVGPVTIACLLENTMAAAARFRASGTTYSSKSH